MRREVMTFNSAAKNPARGFFWLIGGGVVLALCILLPPIRLVDDDSELRALAGILSVTGIIFGIGALLIRQGTRLDRRRGVVETWNGLAFGARKHRYPIDSFFEVALTRLAMEGEYRTHVFYNVLLTSVMSHK